MTIIQRWPNGTLLAGTVGAPSPCMERIKGIWGGIPWGPREACWALVGRLPWRGAIFLAASTSGGTLSRTLVATLAVLDLGAG